MADGGERDSVLTVGFGTAGRGDCKGDGENHVAIEMQTEIGYEDGWILRVRVVRDGGGVGRVQTKGFDVNSLIARLR